MRIDLHISGPGADRVDRRRCVIAGIGDGEDHIARHDPDRAQGQFQRIGAVADADAIPRSAISGKFGFEPFDLVA